MTDKTGFAAQQQQRTSVVTEERVVRVLEALWTRGVHHTARGHEGVGLRVPRARDPLPGHAGLELCYHDNREHQHHHLGAEGVKKRCNKDRDWLIEEKKRYTITTQCFPYIDQCVAQRRRINRAPQTYIQTTMAYEEFDEETVSYILCIFHCIQMHALHTIYYVVSFHFRVKSPAEILEHVQDANSR